jgi:SAM-dependent methyltransferase
MHDNIISFAQQHASLISGRVLEVGSLNVNGTVRDVLPITIGVDFREGKGVDVVADVCDLEKLYGPESFDCVVSCDALEHMEHWDESLRNMWAVLKKDGIFLLTIAHPKKAEHGYPHDYHRIELVDMVRMFAGNEIYGSFAYKPSQGVCVKKTGSIDYSVRPFPVRKK